MASLKEMRNRIGSVKATQKITKAMQMVAAAKLRRAQDAAQSARPYAERMASVIANLAQGVSGESAPRLLAGTGADQRHVLVVATSDRGLAGGFNTSIVRAARERISSLVAAGKDVKLIVVGKKARDQLRRLHGDKIIDFYEAGGKPSMDVAQAVAAGGLQAGLRAAAIRTARRMRRVPRFRCIVIAQADAVGMAERDGGQVGLATGGVGSLASSLQLPAAQTLYWTAVTAFTI